MDTGVRATHFMPDDPHVFPGFYRDPPGLGVRHGVGYAGLRWISAGPGGQPGA